MPVTTSWEWTRSNWFDANVNGSFKSSTFAHNRQYAAQSCLSARLSSIHTCNHKFGGISSGFICGEISTPITFCRRSERGLLRWISKSGNTYLALWVSLGNLANPSSRPIATVQDVLRVLDRRKYEPLVERFLENHVLLVQPLALVLDRASSMQERRTMGGNQGQLPRLSA